MDEKTLKVLEYPRVLERLSSYAAFSLSAEMALALRPTEDMDIARLRQARTSEARRLLSINSDISVSGARDITAKIDLARRGGVLDAVDLLDVKNTLIAARELARSLERQTEQYPHLAAIALRFPPPAGVVDAITRAISERGEVMDSASDALAAIRRNVKIAHDRLLSRLERIINDPHHGPMLQENIITTRAGRYVIPLRAEFKGRIRSIIHDQSSSGATLFVEPLVVVELNNQWHEYQLAERDEERRILADLSRQVGFNAEQLLDILNALAEFDLALMCAKYADDLRAAEPVFAPQRKGLEHHPGTVIKLTEARHPLLPQDTVVPIDVDLDDQTFAVVITGPNTGGKTVSLKTVGLMVLMAQSGLHIPARSGSALSLFSNVYADIGDEQSIEQSLSTFSGHITNIVRILRRASTQTLVLLDELGAGTDPQEGAALARSLLQYLVDQRIPCLVATHYPELKSFAHTTAGVVNASMEFNLKTLRPTYHLTIGLPGRSNALLIAERLGLPQPILDSARADIDPNDLRAEDLLDEIHHQRDVARKARAAADRDRSIADNLRRELDLRLEKIEDERLKIIEQARRQAEKEMQDLHAEAEELRKALSRARQPLEAIKAVQSQVEDLEETTQKPAARRQVTAPTAAVSRPLRIGEKVKLRSLQMEGVVSALGETDLEVQIGSLRVRAKLGDIQRGGEAEPEAAPAVPVARSTRLTRAAEPVKKGELSGVFHPSPGMELDLRGQRAEDALDMLDRYLENAFLANMPFVRIIHGKGTGKLRQAVRDALQQSPHVRRWETGMDKEGGEGVTVAHLDSN